MKTNNKKKKKKQKKKHLKKGPWDNQDPKPSRIAENWLFCLLATKDPPKKKSKKRKG